MGGDLRFAIPRRAVRIRRPMIPIRCYTCGKVTASAHAELERRVSEGKPSGDALDCLGMQRICCRRMLVSHPSSLDELCRAHDQSMRRMPIRFDTVVQGPRAVDAIRRDAPAPAPMQRLYPLRDDPSSVLYRFPTSEPAALALLVDRLVDRPDVAFAWTEAPHPLSPANDLLVSMVDGGGVTSSLSAIDRAIREALSDVSTHFETTLSRLTSMPDEPARRRLHLREHAPSSPARTRSCVGDLQRPLHGQHVQLLRRHARLAPRAPAAPPDVGARRDGRRADAGGVGAGAERRHPA